MWNELYKFAHSLLIKHGKAIGWTGFGAGLIGFLQGVIWFMSN
jgi:hypothetical protein